MELSSRTPSIPSSTSIQTLNLKYPKPNSPFASISSSIQISLNSHIPAISPKKIAVSLITGSVLLMGCLCRPAPALSTLHARASETTLEKKRKEEDGGDVEIMWERYLDNNPKDIKALKILVYEKMGKGKNCEAVKYVERLVELERDEVEWRLLRGLCYDFMGDHNTAKRVFNDILKERPLLVRALHGLAMVMNKNNEGPAMYEMLNEALELARREKRVTEERNIGILIAQMHVIKGELEEGLVKFQGLIDENPRDFRPYLCQGIILSLLDRKEEAEQQFMTYHSLVPEEFPQKVFLDDIVLEAKTKSQEHLQKDTEAQFVSSPSTKRRTTNVA